MTRVWALLFAGVVLVVAAHVYQVGLLTRNAAAERQAAMALVCIEKGEGDSAAALIEGAILLSPKNPSLYYDASGIYAVQAMSVFVKGGTEHYPWLVLSMDAAQKASKLSGDWFYLSDYANTLLFAFVYEYPVDLHKVLAAYEDIPEAPSAAVNQQIAFRTAFVRKALTAVPSEGSVQ